MAETDTVLSWGGLIDHPSSKMGEESSMAILRASLRAMTRSALAKDAELEDLQRRLMAATAEVKQGRAREIALLRRAEKSEEAEEALASQMVDVEAEAFKRIAEAKVRLAALTGKGEPIPTSQAGELQRRLQAALEEAADWRRRCKVLEEEAEKGKVREAALQRRAEIAEAGEEALASQMAELEAEAFTRITESAKSLTAWKGPGSKSLREERFREEPGQIASREVSELERRLAGAEEALEAANVKIRQAEEKNRWLEKRLGQLEQAEGEKEVALRRKGGEATLLSLSLQDLSALVKLKLWSPSSLTLIPSR